jgi:threonyl-tRNA synthetase
MTQPIIVSLPDGSVREMPQGSTPADVAAAIGPGLAKAALAARVNGELRDLNRPFDGDSQLALVTARDEADALELARHDYAHVLAEAVQALWPGTQITFGPATDDGFYYDVMAPASRAPFSMEDLPAIEEKMREIIRADKPLTREVWTRQQLIDKWRADGESFKAEWAAELPEGEELTVYRSGPKDSEDSWLDMCRGPHLPSTGKLDPAAFKLMRVAGAYWRGDQKNAQLTRIYGTGWLTKKQLDAHLTRLEEAAKRDHRRLGREMDLFHLQEEAHGSVFWHPNGFRIWRALEAYMRRAIDEAGYREVKTPQVMDARQWEQSGHWGKYRANMFVIPDEVPNVDDEGPVISGEADWMALKPMNCPAHVLIFKQGITSYRDLPLRIYENGCCHRNEPHGALHGLMRVRQFTQDDAHIFCREDQIESETARSITLAKSIHADFGLETDHINLATRPETRAGSDEFWDKAEAQMLSAARAAGVEPVIAEGDGAFYAPKLDFVIKDAIGREWTIGTIQLDYVLPDRLDAEYVGEDGGKHRPVMLHRAILGSLERFIGVLIENYAGAFPMWLSPVQVVVASISEGAHAYAEQAAEELRAQGLRVAVDTRGEKINYKIREHSLQKVPVIAVVGAKEAEERKLALRRFGSQANEVVLLDDAKVFLANEALPPDIKRAKAG